MLISEVDLSRDACVAEVQFAPLASPARARVQDSRFGKNRNIIFIISLSSSAPSSRDLVQSGGMDLSFLYNWLLEFPVQPTSLRLGSFCTADIRPREARRDIIVRQGVESSRAEKQLACVIKFASLPLGGFSIPGELKNVISPKGVFR